MFPLWWPKEGNNHHCFFIMMRWLNWHSHFCNHRLKKLKVVWTVNFKLKYWKIWNFRIRNLKSVDFHHFWNAVPGGQIFFFSFFSYRARYTCSFCSIYTKKASTAARNKPLLVRPRRQVFIENIRTNWGVFRCLSLYILQRQDFKRINPICPENSMILVYK